MCIVYTVHTTHVHVKSYMRLFTFFYYVFDLHEKKMIDNSINIFPKLLNYVFFSDLLFFLFLNHNIYEYVSRV